ncbi:unnamed protein product [Closterium sp. NIES-53]
MVFVATVDDVVEHFGERVQQQDKVGGLGRGTNFRTKVKIQQEGPTPPVALPCPALPVALPCWLRTALPCPSHRLARCAPPCPTRHAALLAERRPALRVAPPCWLHPGMPVALLGRPIQFDTSLDDLQLYLLCDSRDSVSLFDHTSGASLAPPDTADSATCSQWLTHDVASLSPEDLITHLRTSDTRYRAALKAEFLDKNPPPTYINLYFIVSRLPKSLRVVRDHFLALDPTDLTFDLLKKHLLAAKTSIVAVGAACGTPCTPLFEGCSPSPLAPSYASSTAVDIISTQEVGAASAPSRKRRSGKGKGGRSGGGGSGGGGGGGSGGGRGGGGVGGSGGGSGGIGGGGGGCGGSGGGGGGSSGSGGGGSGGSRGGAVQRGGFDGDRAGQTCGKFHTQHRCFSCLDDAWRAEFGNEAKRPCWQELLRSGVDIFALDYDAILAAMYTLTVSAKGDCYLCVLPDPGIEAGALGASESALPSTTPAEALHTFTLDSSASRCFFRDSTTLTPVPALVPVRLANPSRGPVLERPTTTLSCPAVPSGSVSRLHLPSFSTNLVSVSGQVAAPCSCRLLSHQTLLWHNRLGQPSVPHLRGMHSRLLVSGLTRSLPPLPPSPAPPFLPCVEGQQRAAPHSSISPNVCSPVDSPHGRVGPSPFRLQLHERFRADLPVLRLHSDRGGEFSFDLLRDFCRGEGILQSFTLRNSPQKNGVSERRIGLVMEVARTSMIHAVAPHFLWPFAVRLAMLWCSGFGVLVRLSADKLSSRAIPCVFLGFPPDAPGWQFYHPTSRRVLSSQDVTFDESVPFYRLFPFRTAPLPPPPLSSLQVTLR